MSNEHFAQIMARLDALEARLGLADSHLDAKHAADYLGISVRRIYAGARTGTLKHVQVDGRGTVKTKKGLARSVVRGEGVVMTKDEHRRAFPKASRWEIELHAAFERVSSIEIGSRIPRADLEAAILHKLTGDAWPWKPKDWKPNQALKKAATLALDDAIKPRRNGGKRGRPSLGVDAVVVAILACFEGHQRCHDEARLQTVVIDHLQASVHRRLTICERRSVRADLEVITEARGRSVAWRAWLTKWRQILKKTDAE